MLLLAEGWDEANHWVNDISDGWVYGYWSGGNLEGYGTSPVPSIYGGGVQSGQHQGRWSGGGSFFIEGGAHNWENIDFGSFKDTLFIGFAYYGDYGGPRTDGCFQLADDGGRRSFSVSHDGNSGLWVARSHLGWRQDSNTYTRQLVSTVVCPFSPWRYMEFAFRIHASAGWIEMRMDGQLIGAYYGGVQEPQPILDALNVTTSTTGGSIPAGTYLVAQTWSNAVGETMLGPIRAITTTGSTSTISVPPSQAHMTMTNGSFGQNFPVGVTGWNLYMSQTNGTVLYRQNAALLTNNNTYVLTTNPTNTGPQAPAANTTTTATGRANANGNTQGGSWANGTRRFCLGTQGANGDAFVADDLYINDNTVQSANMPNDDFLGDVKVVRLNPIAAGTHSDFTTGSTGTPTGGIANPNTAPNVATSTASGTVPVGSYTGAYTWLNANGETQIGPTFVVTLAAVGQFTVTPPGFPATVTGWNLYVSQVGGSSAAMTLQNATPNPSGAVTISATPTSTGKAPPYANGTGVPWQVLADQPVQGDAQYITSQTVNAEETVRFSPLPTNTVTVFGIIPQVIARKSDLGPRSAGLVIRYDAANFEITIASKPAPIGYTTWWQPIETRQDTQPFTVADVNAMEIGIQITA